MGQTASSCVKTHQVVSRCRKFYQDASRGRTKIYYLPRCTTMYPEACKRPALRLAHRRPATQSLDMPDLLPPPPLSPPCSLRRHQRHQPLPSPPRPRPKLILYAATTTLSRQQGRKNACRCYQHRPPNLSLRLPPRLVTQNQTSTATMTVVQQRRQQRRT